MTVTRVPVLTLLTVLLAGRGARPGPAAGAPAPAAPAASTRGTGDRPRPRRAETKPDAVEPQGFTYNPEGRRDPFVSLLRRGVDCRADGPACGGPGRAWDGRSELARHAQKPGSLRRHRRRAWTARPTSCARATSCRTVRSVRLLPTRWSFCSRSTIRFRFRRNRQCGSCFDRRKRGSSGEVWANHASNVPIFDAARAVSSPWRSASWLRCE